MIRGKQLKKETWREEMDDFFNKGITPVNIQHIKNTASVYSCNGKNIQAIIGVLEFKALATSSAFNPEDYVVISILDPDDSISTEEELKLFKKSLHIRFWDIEEDIGKYTVISDENAKTIAQFIIDNKDEKFIIHCAAGMSRSAGTGLAVNAIIDHYGDKYTAAQYPSEIKAHTRYHPNLSVYDKIMDEYNKLVSHNLYQCPSCIAIYDYKDTVKSMKLDKHTVLCPHCFEEVFKEKI